VYNPRKAWRCGCIVGDVLLTPPPPLLVKPFLYGQDTERGDLKD
jgi:hypothetical protein